jgi:hypothetical protein
MIRLATLLALVLASTAAAQSTDRAERIREAEARIAAREEHADAVHQQQRAAREAEQATECRDTYAERLEDAKRAITATLAELRERKRVGADAAISWFDAHCRFLSKLEIVVRKLDDENAFVCDTAKGRPAALTGAFLLRYMNSPPAGEFQARRAEDLACEPYDAAERESLVSP